MSNHPLVDSYSYPTLKNLGLKDNEKLIIMGPCAVESMEQLDAIAKFLKENGIKFFRAGAFKPRTSVYDFHGLGIKGLTMLQEIKKKYGLKIVTEITSTEYLHEMLEVADIIQVGARNMQNFELLKILGSISKPILLKRGFGNTLEEFFCAAEYILKGGNQNLILCERGVRTFDPATRNILDLGAVAIIKSHYQIPIITDPSHAMGHSELVLPLSLASFSVQADGIIVEVHNDPKLALSDGEQALTLEQAKVLIEELKKHQYL